MREDRPRVKSYGGSTPTQDEIAGSPAWYPLETLPPAGVRLIRLDEAAYRSASFLDQRLLSMGYPQHNTDPALLEAAAAQLTPAAHFIFHTGHVGSTLVSRLIGAYAAFFSLREPALLRAFATDSSPGSGVLSLATAATLLGRRWREQQRAVIKATSFASELAESLLGAEHQPRAIFMFVQPLAYLRSIFAGANSRAEIRQLADARLRRLARRLPESGGNAEARSEGEIVAMSWLCEMTTLRQAADRFGAQVLWVDFDGFLAAPCAGLQGMFAALGARPAAPEIEALVTGPLMQQYSKAPEHPYDARLRSEVMVAAEREHGAEIRRGMLWLQQMARRHPLVASVLR